MKLGLRFNLSSCLWFTALVCVGVGCVVSMIRANRLIHSYYLSGTGLRACRRRVVDLEHAVKTTPQQGIQEILDHEKGNAKELAVQRKQTKQQISLLKTRSIRYGMLGVGLLLAMGISRWYTTRGSVTVQKTFPTPNRATTPAVSDAQGDRINRSIRSHESARPRRRALGVSARRMTVLIALAILFVASATRITWQTTITGRPIQTRFDSVAWKNAESSDDEFLRFRMIDDLLASKRLLGMKESEVADLLGTDYKTDYIPECEMSYYLCQEWGSLRLDYLFLCIGFDEHGNVATCRVSVE